MKSVLISIKPKWCDLIASGEKTIEVRKTRPKCDTPFKCYIYCTKAKQILRYVEHPNTPSEKPIFCKTKDGSSAFCEERYGNGKVIGEFVCDRVQESILPADGLVDVVDCQKSCLTAKEIINYACGKLLYFWHISDLVIYDEPKELIEFCKFGFDDDYSRWEDLHTIGVNGVPCVKYAKEPNIEDYIIKHPPQSWCYVEEI